MSPTDTIYRRELRLGLLVGDAGPGIAEPHLRRGAFQELHALRASAAANITVLTVRRSRTPADQARRDRLAQTLRGPADHPGGDAA